MILSLVKQYEYLAHQVENCDCILISSYSYSTILVNLEFFLLTSLFD